jgi:nucleoside-diphosphate-sugar epimerase
LLEIKQAILARGLNLTGLTVTVTGGTGFLGRWLVDAMLLMGVHVNVLSRDPARALVRIPYWSDSVLKDKTGDCDYFFHAANDVSMSRNHVLDLAKQAMDLSAARSAKKFLFLGSGGVYSAAADRPHTGFHENQKLDLAASNLNEYSAGKLLVEQEGVRRTEVQFLSLRCFSFLGPHLDLDSSFAAAQFLKSALQGQPIRVSGTGQAVRSYLYPTDWVIALITLMLQQNQAAIYNIGSIEAVTISQLAQKIARTFGGLDVVIENGSSPVASKSLSGLDRYLPSIDLIQSELQWAPRVMLDEAIARTKMFLEDTKTVY